MNPEEVKKLAEDAILAGKVGRNLPGSGVCSSKKCFKKVRVTKTNYRRNFINKFQLEETLTRNKKKKLKKKRKRHRDILEQQLREIEGMSVDMVDSPEQKVFINSNT